MRELIYKLTHPLFKLYWKIFRPKTVGTKALLVHNNNILLVKNINVKKWSLPGGKVDGKETPEHCIKRELREELGLENVNIERMLGTYVSNHEGKQDTIHVFVVHLPSLLFTKKWELQAADWFSLDSLPKDTSPATKRRIEEYVNNIKHLHTTW